jgi:hypothetical protein
MLLSSADNRQQIHILDERLAFLALHYFKEGHYEGRVSSDFPLDFAKQDGQFLCCLICQIYHRILLLYNQTCSYL